MIRCAGMAAMLLVAAGMAHAQPAAEPGTEWASVTPEAAGWSTTLLAEAHDYADQTGTASLMVVQHAGWWRAGATRRAGWNCTPCARAC